MVFNFVQIDLDNKNRVKEILLDKYLLTDNTLTYDKQFHKVYMVGENDYTANAYIKIKKIAIETDSYREDNKLFVYNENENIDLKTELKGINIGFNITEDIKATKLENINIIDLKELYNIEIDEILRLQNEEYKNFTFSQLLVTLYFKFFVMKIKEKDTILIEKINSFIWGVKLWI